MTTVQAILDLHTRAEARVHRHQRAVETLTQLVGRPVFLQVTLGVLAAWMLWNSLGRLAHLPSFDPPPFYWMQGAVGLGAFLLTIVVLITQNRLGRVEERRAQLDLQISLLTEQKITKLIEMMEQVCRKVSIGDDCLSPQIEQMKEPADPAAVLVALDATLGSPEQMAELQQLVEAESDSEE